MYAGVKTMQKKGEKEPVRLRDILVSAASMGLTLCVSLCIGIACGYWVDTAGNDSLGAAPGRYSRRSQWLLVYFKKSRALYE